MKLDFGHYLTRNGKLVRIFDRTSMNIWSWEGEIYDSEETDFETWTSFGGFSSSHGIKPPIEANRKRFEHRFDLVQLVTKETHPEYFL